MTPELLTRLVLAMAIVGGGIALYWLTNRLLLYRVQQKALTPEFDTAEQPSILYFTTPTCAPCITLQRPALQNLQERLGERVRIVEVDASANPEIASRWGVLSVPTTFVLDARGRPRHVNHGVATTDKLQKQLANLN